MVVGGLYIAVESMVFRHVAKVRSASRINRPALGEHDYLGQLGAGSIVVGAERAVRVTGDDIVAGEIHHSFVEVIAWMHVAERNIALSGRRCRSDARPRSVVDLAEVSARWRVIGIIIATERVEIAAHLRHAIVAS